MAIDIIARGMIEDFNSDISQLSEKVSNHTDNSDIHVTVSDKENWNSHPNDVMASGNPVQIDGLQGGVPFSDMIVSGDDIVGQNITLWACKKNLIPYPYSRASGTYNGIELIVHDDGRFDMSGTATASFAILVFAGSSNPIYLSGGQTYTISCNTPYDFSKFNISAKIYHTDGSYTSIIKFPTTFVAQEGEYLHCTLWIESDVSVSAKNVELQLEYGDTATDYEPYSGATYTITPDSNPYTVPNDIRQQDGLNNISVSEGEISVTGVRKNAAIKRIWDDMGMDLLFDGVTSADNPAVIDLANYNMIRIDVGGNYGGTSYFNCGSTYFLKSTLDYAVTSYGKVAMAMSNQAVIIDISKSGADYSLSFRGLNTNQLVDVIKIFGIK